jgi:hypothetical protein
MCLNQRRYCHCRRNSAFLIFRDNLLPPEILVNLYCPACRHLAVGDGATRLEDCGWVLEYDVDRAQSYFNLRGVQGAATPQFIFDEGYLSWQGLAPGDEEVNRRLHQRLAPLIEEDLTRYLKTLKEEWVEHAAALKAAGWRKAQAT